MYGRAQNPNDFHAWMQRIEEFNDWGLNGGFAQDREYVRRARKLLEEATPLDFVPEKFRAVAAMQRRLLAIAAIL